MEPPHGQLLVGPEDGPPVWALAQREFGERFGGIAGFGDGGTVLVVPDGGPLPASFEGFPVAAAEYSWSEIEAAGARANNARSELAARGVEVISSGIHYWVPGVGIVVVGLDDEKEAALIEVLGEGPWLLSASAAGPPDART